MSGAFRLILAFVFVAAIAATLASCADPPPASTMEVRSLPSLSPTFTPRPTFTSEPDPSPTPTDAPSPTWAPTASPSASATSTPIPIPSPSVTPHPPTPAPQPSPTSTAAATPEPTEAPPPGDGFEYDVTMQRMLTYAENGGTVGMHNIFVKVFDASGNPLDGVTVCRLYALQLQPPDPHACGISGEKGPGTLEFDMYSGDVVFVASSDEAHSPLSPYTRALEQEPVKMDVQELVDCGYCQSVEDCQQRIPINNLPRFHYSYEVRFTRRW